MGCTGLWVWGLKSEGPRAIATRKLERTLDLQPERLVEGVALMLYVPCCLSKLQFVITDWSLSSCVRDMRFEQTLHNLSKPTKMLMMILESARLGEP